MTTPLLEVKNLSVSFKTDGNNEAIVVKDISFSLSRGKITALVGESGSGKSVSALSILRLLPCRSTGQILFNGKNLLEESPSVLQEIRGNRIAMIFQEPMTSLNPLHSIKKQVAEAITLHNSMTKGDVSSRVAELMSLVGLDELKNRMHSFPHELSGGQRQRVMIAMALANNPDILIADEPTTALDVTIQAQIFRLLQDLQKRLNMTILLITHDLTIVRNIADKVMIMYRGELVETGDVTKIFASPKHSYTKHLLSSAPTGEPVPLPKKAEKIISTTNLQVHFPIKKGAFGRVRDYIKAVDNVTLDIKRGQTLGVVGESGSGKTTLGLALLRLIKSQGVITFNDNDLQTLNNKDLRPLRRKMQIVFQDPFSSLNPRLSVGQIIAEGLIAHNIGNSAKERDNLVVQALIDVGLDPKVATRYPHEFSGGQRQRIGVARALILKPDFMVLDEPTSALDISTQAEIINMLKRLQKDYALAFLFISHDLRVIKAISHNVIIMKGGKIVEQGSRDEIFTNPQTIYTKALISAAFEVKASSD